jgi:hypothetical protein
VVLVLAREAHPLVEVCLRSALAEIGAVSGARHGEPVALVEAGAGAGSRGISGICGMSLARCESWMRQGGEPDMIVVVVLDLLYA